MSEFDRILGLNQEGLLAEVVGFETDEVAYNANGAVVETYGGRTFIDFTGGIAVHACGHGHPEIVDAIKRQAESVLHTSDIMRHAPQLELGGKLAELFGSILPGEPWTFLLLNSGSESIDAAAKLTLKATGRNRFVAFEGAFHGRTMFATALSRSKCLHWSAYEDFLAPLRAHILHAPAPRCRPDCDGCEVGCVAGELERILDQVGHDVAALFFEAQQGEGGYFPMCASAAKRIRELTRERDILLVADEIQSGFGRTGKWFGFQHLGIEPDIVVFGKAIGGGLPLAGFAARRSLMERWQPGEHGTTFGGNPLSCAAGLAALNVIERDGLVQRAAQLGETIKSRLTPLIGTNGITDVRGNGLMIGIELRDAFGKPDYAGCEQVKLRARDQGLLLLTCGAKIGSERADCAAIRLIPPLNTSDADLDHGLEILVVALKWAKRLAA